MNISELDATIVRKNGRGSSVKIGNKRFAIVDGGREEMDTVVSLHRSSKAAMKSAKEGQSVWMWDSYLGTQGGYRRL